MLMRLLCCGDLPQPAMDVGCRVGAATAFCPLTRLINRYKHTFRRRQAPALPPHIAPVAPRAAALPSMAVQQSQQQPVVGHTALSQGCSPPAATRAQPHGASARALVNKQLAAQVALVVHDRHNCSMCP